MSHVAACFKETILLFNVHLSCFVEFILCSTNKYMFKVNNKTIRLICWMRSELKINTAWHSSGVFIDFDHSQYINIVFLLLKLWTSIRQKGVKDKSETIYLFPDKSCKTYFIQWFIIAPNWYKLWTNDHTMNMLWT